MSKLTHYCNCIGRAIGKNKLNSAICWTFLSHCWSISNKQTRRQNRFRQCYIRQWWRTWSRTHNSNESWPNWSIKFDFIERAAVVKFGEIKWIGKGKVFHNTTININLVIKIYIKRSPRLNFSFFSSSVAAFCSSNL